LEVIEVYQRDNFSRHGMSYETVASYFEKQLKLEQREATGLMKLLFEKYGADSKSRYENHRTYLFLKNLESEVWYAADDLGYRVKFKGASVASLIGADVNAGVYHLEEYNEYLIFIGQGLLFFLDAIMRSAICLFEWKSSGGYRLSQQHALDEMNRRPEIVRYVVEAYSAFLRADLPSILSLTPPKVPSHMESTYGALRHAAWLFVIGHEYSHIFHGDVGEDHSISVDVIRAANGSPLRHKLEWQKEFAADARGFEFMNHVMNFRYGCNAEFNMMASVAFFASVDSLYRQIERITGFVVANKNSTHPAPIPRWQTVASAIFGAVDDMSIESFESAEKLADIIEVIHSFVELNLIATQDRKEIADIWCRS
ncbi:MAG: hypothetical protein AAGB04_30130, partial [Pseudomonadota bacterium]